MRKQWIKCVVAVGAVACMGMTTHAVQIDGTVKIGNIKITTDTGNLSDASAITSFSGARVLTGSGTYDNVQFLTPVTMTGFTFTPSLDPSPVTVWQFTANSVSYSFSLGSVKVDDQGKGFLGVQYLDLSGTGIASIDGYDSTPGTWALNADQVGCYAFSFLSCTDVEPTVPDGGATVMLLGCSLIGLFGWSALGRRSTAQ